MNPRELEVICDAALVESLQKFCPELCRQVDECLAAGWAPPSIMYHVTRGGTGKVLALAVEAYIAASYAEMELRND